MRLVKNMLKYHQSETKQKKHQIVSTHMLIYNKTFVFFVQFITTFLLHLHFVCIVFCVSEFVTQNHLKLLQQWQYIKEKKDAENWANLNFRSISSV